MIICDDLQEALGLTSLTIDVDEEAAAVMERLGSGWLKAALLPVLLAYKQRTLVVGVVIQNKEPMLNLGHPFAEYDVDKCEGGNRGSITMVRQDEPECLRLRRQKKFLCLPSESLLDGHGTFTFIRKADRLRTLASHVYSYGYRHHPRILDTYRQKRHTRWGYWREVVYHPFMIEPYEPDPHCMWVAMHWAEPGGAESWGFEQARIAREAGYKVVMTFDRLAPQRIYERAAAVADEVLFNAQVLDGGDDQQLLVPRLLQKYRPSRIHIHHSSLAYDASRDIKAAMPQVKIEDSTHIIEHRNGGFVTASMNKADVLDLHHVISPVLRDELIAEGGVDPQRVVYRPLTRMGVKAAGKKELFSAVPHLTRTPGQKLRVGFLGRLSLQKRPYLFLEVVKELHRSHPDKFEFVMQGSGELNTQTTERISELGLDDVIERRTWGPIDSFLSDVDVLLITSDNEGLTLTTLEASDAQVLVVSADVGSQITVVAREALCPAMSIPFVRKAKQVLTSLADDPDYMSRLLTEQLRMAQKLHQLESASEFFANHYADPQIKE